MRLGAFLAAMLTFACGGDVPEADVDAGARDAFAPGAPSDAGDAGEVADADAGADPAFTGPTVCSSGRTGTNQVGFDMLPGQACNACHRTRATRFLMGFAGTVYPTGHEPDTCVGVDGEARGTRVVVTDAKGQELALPVRASGNFAALLREPSVTRLSGPFSIRVEEAGRVRRMQRTLVAGEGDCNACHTERGTNGAPGRIAAP